MKIVILGGNSERNRDWVLNVAKALQGYDTLPHLYKHWQDHTTIDIDAEIPLIASHVPGSYIIIAKSAGAIITLKGIHEHKLAPEAVVFMGTAIHWAESQGLPVRTWMPSLAVPTLCIQNQDDPAISATDLQGIIGSHANYTLTQLPGNTHEYELTDVLVNKIRAFIDSHK